MKTLNPAVLVLEALTAKVAELFLVVVAAAEAVKLAEEAVAEAHRAAAATPADSTRRAHRAALEALAAAKKAHADAVAAHTAAHNEEEEASLRDIRNRQSALASELRIDKRAARDPEIAQLRSAHKSRGVALEALNVEIGKLRAAAVESEKREGALEKQIAARDAKILKLEERLAKKQPAAAEPAAAETPAADAKPAGDQPAADPAK